MKIAFLYPKWSGEYGLFGHFAKRNSTWMPQNIALLAAIAEEHGHTVSIIDGQAEGLSEKEMLKRALALKPDLFSLTCYSPFTHINSSLAEKIKQSGNKAPILVGGPHITILNEKVLERYPQFDYLFLGEAEHSLPNFLKVYEQGGDLSQVAGITFRKEDGSVVIGIPQKIPMTVKVNVNNCDQVFDLDRYPFPARHLLPMNKYRLGTYDGRMLFTQIHTMRGCPAKCIFCASEVLNTTRMAMRSPRSVVDEIKQVLRKHPKHRHFFLTDDVCTLYFDKHLRKICELIIEEGLDITLEGGTRANLLTEEMVALMKQAGFIRLSFGLETVNEEMRKTMRKGVELKHYSKANELCAKYNIEAMNSVMLGLPGETQETIEELAQFLANDRNVKQANCSIAIPYPGTEFNQMAVAGNYGLQLLSDDFSQYLRYGNAVTNVGGISGKDLIKIQNMMFLRIYSKPWRWKPMYNKHGLMGFYLLLVRWVRYHRDRYLGWEFSPIMTHPKDSF